MSVTVEVNYEQIGIQCESVCEVAEQQLAEMDKMLDELVSTSTRLMNVQTEELQKSILAEKDKLIEQIRLVREKAATEAKQGTIHVNNHEARYNEIMAHKDDAIKAANNLQQQSNMLASQKFVEFRALIDTILSDKIASYEQKMRDRANGIVRLDMNVKALLDSIADATLRQFTYLAYLQNPDLFGDDLIAAGKTMMNTTVE